MHSELPVRALPRSSRNKVVLDPAGKVRVWVTASPTDGQANHAVCELIARALGVSKSSVTLIRGQSSRDKVLHIDGLDLTECRARLGRASQ